MEEDQKNFNVVFEGIGTDKGGNFKGVRTWMSFNSEDDFDKWLEKRGINEVYRKGVDQDEAIALCELTSIEAYVDSAFEDAQMEDGRYCLELLDVKLTTVKWAAHEAIDSRIEKRMRELLRKEVSNPVRKEITPSVE